jgi:hypothetical protein
MGRCFGRKDGQAAFGRDGYRPLFAGKSAGFADFSAAALIRKKIRYPIFGGGRTFEGNSEDDDEF